MVKRGWEWSHDVKANAGIYVNKTQVIYTEKIHAD